MYFSTLIISILAFGGAAHGATTYKVNVGANGLTFEPNNFMAEVGSYVEFSFFPKNHSIAQSTFSNPCQPLPPLLAKDSNFQLPQIFSGFLPTTAPGPNSLTFTIKINDLKPLWLYCSQTVGNHCQSGMVLSINAPTTGENTFANYLAKARSANVPSRNPDNGVQGGVLAQAGQGQQASYRSTFVQVTSESATSVTQTVTGAAGGVSEVVMPTSTQVVLVVVTSWPVQSTITATATATVSVGVSASSQGGGAGLGMKVGGWEKELVSAVMGFLGGLGWLGLM